MADANDGGESGSPALNAPLSARQQMLATTVRCHAEGTTNVKRPHCQAVAVVAYGPIALCGICDKMRSAVGRTHGPRRLPGAELTTLIDAARALAQAEAEVAIAVGLARAAGASWSQIGDAVGVSRQGAQQRWGDVVDRASGLPTRVDAVTDPVGEEVSATS
ncbi:MAG: hypothetical protein ACRDZ9_01930 [Acidimicrobiales bacterium]